MLRKVNLLEEEISSLQTHNSTLHELVTEKEKKIEEVEEQSTINIQELEQEVVKEKKIAAELICLLEGVSTNSDHLPTGQVIQTTNAPLDEYLLRRCESNDSIQSVEDIKDDLSESGTSLKQQMDHTIESYEKQIRELQLLYDQDVFTLETENEDLNSQLQALKEQCATANSSSQMTTENAEELENSYKIKLEELTKEYERMLHNERKNATLNMSSLKEENEKLMKMLQSNEDEYMKIMVDVKKEMFSRSYSDAHDKVQDLIGKTPCLCDLRDIIEHYLILEETKH